MTAQEISTLPSGRVLRRTITPQGKHQKMRVVKAVKYCVCDICDSEITDKAVKTESGGSITILTQCPSCAAQELNDASNS